MTTKNTIADEADYIIRARYCDAYEVLYDPESDSYVVAMPRSYEECGEPKQPTAVIIGYAGDFEDGEQLYAAALRYADEVHRLAETTEEW